MMLTKDSDGSKLEKVIEELEEQLTEQEQLKESLVLVVDTFKGIEHKILKLKYIEGKSLESISEELSYSPGYIRQKHAELRRRLEFLEEYEAYKFKLNQMK
ncbi:hypothetical protein [Marinilactibacillus psychrotolerans]|uniref:hypothetical protein n=1 Tax=Marinilactibacillus psychrotolerans TaxID=191770 RepID=UPI001FD2CF60|nr:hypothetical protein [Marinilactibacillus psychrotolerans]